MRVALRAASLEELLDEGAAVVRELVAGEGAEARAGDMREIVVSGDDAEELLLGTLKELVFLFDTESFVPAAVDIRTRTAERTVLRVRGERFDPARHAPQPEVKAVTRHGLVVSERDGRWEAEVVFDL